ncbi:condensation domain-containing protein [Lentzea sp. NPDC051838]|uniref:condensation domain-containing protein n=1 Tax=Lentzea sp. NPDC051838 TaxID=3154849 RepID=UPI0034254BD8
MGQLEVEFTGSREGSTPVTLGQANVLEWIGEQEQERSDILCRFVPVPDGCGLEDIRESLAVLLARHESLRTTVQPGPEAVQTVVSEGTLVAEIHEGDTEPALRERIAGTRFDFGRDLPLRVAISTRDGSPHVVALALSHLAADFASMELLAGQFGQMLEDPAARTVGTPAVQPLDQAEHESQSPARRRAESALRFWETQLRRMPQAMFSHPPLGPAGCREGYLKSRAAGLVLPSLVARTGVSHSTVLLALAATLLAVRTGNPLGALVSICGNRFRPGMASYVGTIAQDALVPFELSSSTVDDVVRGVRLATMNAYRYSQFDARKLWPVMDAVADERGTRFQRDCVFNDVGAHQEDRVIDPAPPNLGEVAGALADTAFQWLPATSYPVACYFTVIRAGREVELALYGDTRYLPEPDIEAFLRGVEALVVASAERPVPVAEVAVLTGISPIERGAGWVYRDACWVEIAAVQLLLDEVVDGPARVFDHDGELVAYVTEPVTPREVHVRCLAALPGRYTTVAPSRYVVVSCAPTDLTDQAAWAAQPVVAAGTGRSAEIA